MIKYQELVKFSVRNWNFDLLEVAGAYVSVKGGEVYEVVKVKGGELGLHLQEFNQITSKQRLILSFYVQFGRKHNIKSVMTSYWVSQEVFSMFIRQPSI